ncbi:hypothetical protein [Microbaculum marinum]|uniref:PepSY domain-containing protein n=1 Tax=Microbaculum marinum TaxID=1764581 RepID=A0AAW9RZG2_9HYPH
MKKYVIGVAAAGVLFAGSAFAQSLTAEQEMAMQGHLTPATVAGSEVIPAADTADWSEGSTLPGTYQITALEVDGMDGYGYVRDETNLYVVDSNRAIVKVMPMTEASAASGEAIPPAGDSDREDVAQPTNQ